MAKYCAVCNKKLGFFEGTADLADGKCCISCWDKAGQERTAEAMQHGIYYAVEIQQLIDGVKPDVKYAVDVDSEASLRSSCVVCGEKIGLMTGTVKVLDGKCCVSCWDRTGFSRDLSDTLRGELYSGQDLKKIIDAKKENAYKIARFKPTKVIKHPAGQVAFDDESKTFVVTQESLTRKSSNLFHYEHLYRFNMEMGSSTRTSGDIGRAAMGGAMFGSGGAVVGAMSNVKSKSSYSKLRIKLLLQNCYMDTAYITFVEPGTSVSGPLAYQANEAAEAVMRELRRISNMMLDEKNERERQEREARIERERQEHEEKRAQISAEYDRRIAELDEDIQRTKKKAERQRAEIAEEEKRQEERRKRREQERKESGGSQGGGFRVRVRVREIDDDNDNKEIVAETSAADEIRKFKQLMDDGIITPEEFEAKKKQLLGL